eukprot:scaffold48759_cov61-Phaeocystis_antarctica.AAC.1
MVSARVAVVTGANKGVGYHIAQSLVHSGLFSVVVLGCRDPTRGQHAAAEIGGCAEYMPLEVGNAASADAFAEALVARHGRCDVLVNNAGIARRMPHAACRMPHAACRTRRAHASCMHAHAVHTPCTHPAHATLVNHAGTAYKGADPTPFKEQARPIGSGWIPALPDRPASQATGLGLIH